MQLIPVTLDANQTFSIVLNGLSMTVTIRWQDIGAGWYMDLYVDESPMLLGSRLNSACGFLASILGSIGGDFVPIPKTTPAEELSRYCWNDTHVLGFLTTAELEEVGLGVF